MSLLAGDLTTPQRVTTWMAGSIQLPSPIISQLIGSMTALIYNKLNRSRLFNQTYTRTFDGVGNMQIVLPDWPVTSITALQQGQALVPPSVLPTPGSPQPTGTNPGYGYRYVPWLGSLPGDPAVIEFVGGYFYTRAQNVKITYQAGYLVANEAAVVPTASPPGPSTITVQQPLGIWCRDNGVTYSDGTPLVAASALTAAGQYIAPSDGNPGLYTFDIADANADVLISYSFIPADLEEACIQMVAERYSYRSRIGELSKSLGGQETIRFVRGNSGPPWGRSSSLPPEVMDLISPYISVIPPAIGAPV